MLHTQYIEVVNYMKLVKGTILRNRYEIIAHLGSGGFADTYLARDKDLPKHPQCVVKNLRPTSPDTTILPIARRLFETEAQVLYLLGQQQDQIPKLFAHFEENNQFYLVQEFVDGHELSQEFTPGKRLSETEVIQLLQDILKILAVVHQQNIIHRDIKPENLMRRRTDSKIVLIDFGAVKEIGTLAKNTQGLVRATIAIGTPGYMPNEQANRDPKLSSDVYAVGMVGIQALTGLMPQQFLQDSATGELLWRDYAQVSNELADILDKMVRCHFSQRYQSASEALQAFNTLAPLPQHRPPVSPSRHPVFNKQAIVARLGLSKPLLQKSIIGLGGLGIGVIVTVVVVSSLNRPQLSDPQPIAAPSQSPSNASLQTTQSPSPIPSVVSEENVNWAFEPKYSYVSNFSEGLARVKINGRWGYIDTTGKLVIEPKFDDAQDFSEGMARVWIVGKNWGYIDKTGKVIIDYQFTKDNANKFSEGLARACLADTCGFIDKTGKFAIERKYYNVHSFFEGLAAVQIDGKWGYIDKSGNVVIQPQFAQVNAFSLKLAAVEKEGKWGYIDISGNLVVQPQFEKAYRFTGNLAPVKQEGKWGYTDKSGNLVVQPQFEEAYIFTESLALVKKDGKFGYVNERGNLVIQPKFSNANTFSEGLAEVQIDGKWGYIDKNGNPIIKLQFKNNGKFLDGLAWVEINDKVGYIHNPLK